MRNPPTPNTHASEHKRQRVAPFNNSAHAHHRNDDDASFRSLIYLPQVATSPRICNTMSTAVLDTSATKGMVYTRLGQTGLHVSRIILGCMSYGSSEWQPWVLDADQALPIMKAAWDAGINTFDTADAYANGESERILGRFLREYQIPRSQVIIATKCFFQVVDGDMKVNLLGMPAPPSKTSVNQWGLSRKHIFDAVDASLQRLGVEYIDLYQIHRWDYNTPIEETMEALHDLVKLGKVRYIGASSMHAWQFAKAQFIAKQREWTPFVSMQNLYNAVYREEERDMVPLCRDLGVGVIPWSPLARGLLAGKKGSVREQTDKARERWFGKTNAAEFEQATNDAVLDRVRAIAERRGVSMARVAIAWLVNRPGVTAPIVGINKPEYIADMIAALHLQLSADEVKEIDDAYYPKRVVGFV
ncbi:hypothetical protein AMAG_10755 [Allomyces macrogynus ATCC 38327]|uniref:NADP-dependent oxidoreductase domain-containing protein n=1 Tax=Allomyces macrogynus (strain ATCC 38327) TaxID=578462 RepID=A0A0L0SRW4_ALLM3|nr:hypothetical protein AMAG_10755 [Allomyces macrogynus ATCC 38327]|eukprot:KNE65094.1 hypothetical protein AMAG_10755 [Allomyces macrogynus ATCC 38327]